MMGELAGGNGSVGARLQLAGGTWVWLESPDRILTTSDPAQVPSLLETAECIARETECYVAGFLTYEAGAAFGLSTRYRELTGPLAWFGCFRADRAQVARSARAGSSYEVGPLNPSLTREQFAAVVKTIKRHLANGDTYQVNYTFRLRAPFSGEPEALFEDLVANQNGEYATYIQGATWAVCCASPELFFSREGNRVTMRPMKGTAPRGRTTAEDHEARERLCASEKERAENVMIVDMIRNDLGRVADLGSIEVPDLFVAERYPTVWQLTSQVIGRSNRSIGALFAALHPCASVTGAPKVRTMEFIKELEPEPRGVYTGAVGYIGPDGSARFGVGIRTAVVDRSSGIVEFGVGSGIVWDSDADGEYDECLLKARVFAPRTPAFDLLETLRWSVSDGFVLLDRHLARLAESSRYFDFPFDRTAAVESLLQAVSGAREDRRVRLLVGPDGRARVEHTAFAPTVGDLRLALATTPVDASDRFLFHKTTRRDVYTAARAAAGQGYDDVVLWNAKGEVTETTVCNILLETRDGLVTPPVSAGLLPGTLREQLLESGTVREAPVRVSELCEIGWCWVVNSVQGWRRGVVPTGARTT